MTQRILIKYAGVISAFIGAAIAVILYVVLVGPLEPIAWFFWVAPVAGGIGFLAARRRDRGLIQKAALDYIQPRQGHTEEERAAQVASIKSETRALKPNFATEDFWDRSATILVWLSACIGILSSLAIVAWQTFVWLKTQSWPELGLSDALRYFNVHLSAIYEPSDWFELAAICQWLLNLPLSLWVPFSLIALSLLWKGFVDS